MKIEIRDNISPLTALELVKRVILEGRVSKDYNGKMYYCWATTFSVSGETYIVYTRDNRKDDCFVVCKAK